MNIEEIKVRLAKIKERENRIPNSEQESVIGQAAELPAEFCKEVFGNPGFQSDGRGPTKGASHYWVVPDKCRIDRERGLCFLESKSKKAFNLLTIWMMHTGIPLDENGVCRDKVQIRKAITSLRSWCEEVSKKKAEEQFDLEAYLLGLKEWVHDAVFQNGRIFFKGTAEQIREMVKTVDGDLFDGIPPFASRREFLKLLQFWIGDRKFFNVHMDWWGKKRVFTLALMP